MKRLICCILIFLELFLLTGCKSGDVREVEKSIEGIGTVSVEKEEKIINDSDVKIEVVPLMKFLLKC